MKEFVKAMWRSTEFWIGWLALAIIDSLFSLGRHLGEGDTNSVILNIVFIILFGLVMWLHVHEYRKSVRLGKIIKEELGIVGDVKVTLK